MAWPHLNNELYRLATFSKYPLNAAKSAVSLAADGFVYTGQDLDDSVTCFFCQSHKNKWQPTDNIRETHRALSCNCPMVTRTFCSNIPVKAKHNYNLIIQSIAPCIIQQKATCDGLSSVSVTDQLNTIRTFTIQATENVLQYYPAKNVSNLATVEAGKHLSVQNVSNLATVETGKDLSVQNVSNLATVGTGKHLSVQNVSHKDTAVLARVAPKKAYKSLQSYTKNLIISEYFHIFITQLLTNFIRLSNMELETNAMPKVKLSLDSDDLTTTCEKVSMARQFQSSSSSNNYKHINYCSWLSYNKLGSCVLLPQDDTSCVKYYDNYFSSKSNDTYLCPVLPYRNQPVDVYVQLAIDYNYSHYKNRLSTFKGWPVHHAVSCVLLAQNGLVFDQEVSEVSCPACNFSRTAQEVGHTIIIDHKHYSPGCLLVSACLQDSTYNSIFYSVTGLANNQVTNNQEHSSEHASASHTGPTINNTEAAFPESPFIAPTSTTLSSDTTASGGTVADSSRATATAAPMSCSKTSSPQSCSVTFCGAAVAIQSSDVETKLAAVTVDEHSTASTMFRKNVINDTETVCKQRENSLIKIKNEYYADLQQRIATIEMCTREYSLNALELAEAGFYWEEMVYSRCGAASSSLLEQPGLSLSADNIIVNSKKQDEL
ncbi:baculoviral IAP repeat-containing protein 2-like isoform X1 [Biomphalaria pfeifferi]|uniref:Baculoviral IAP repeat-containing protein 2-like isoform X1 n=1 Tax=Biomphalaria pfeifferi TaxID=112525 RepID=A0AAD8BE60_BIOPF|nr:baculoviral IAP repeat-containing protein 2-like isoform X1 [Biomphalaria pfeifferi]